MRIAALTYRIASKHRHTIFTRWLLLSGAVGTTGNFILFFLFVRIPDFFEAVLTDDVFNQAGFVFGDFRVYARSDQLHRKKLVPLVDSFRYLTSLIGHAQAAVFVYNKKSALA